MLERPSYWVNGGYQVKASVSDPVEGLNVRADLPGTAGDTRSYYIATWHHCYNGSREYRWKMAKSCQCGAGKLTNPQL